MHLGVSERGRDEIDRRQAQQHIECHQAKQCTAVARGTRIYVFFYSWLLKDVSVRRRVPANDGWASGWRWFFNYIIRLPLNLLFSLIWTLSWNSMILKDPFMVARDGAEQISKQQQSFLFMWRQATIKIRKKEFLLLLRHTGIHHSSMKESPLPQTWTRLGRIKIPSTSTALRSFSKFIHRSSDATTTTTIVKEKFNIIFESWNNEPG